MGMARKTKVNMLLLVVLLVNIFVAVSDDKVWRGFFFLSIYILKGEDLTEMSPRISSGDGV